MTTTCRVARASRRAPFLFGRRVAGARSEVDPAAAGPVSTTDTPIDW